MKQSPRSFPSPRWLVGTQPQRHVRRLHRLPYHSHQVVIEGFQICLVPELGREGFKGLPRVVLPAIEPPVYERLDATPQRSKQCRDKQGGGDDCEGGLLAYEEDERSLQNDDDAEVEGYQHGGQGAVDEGAVYEYVYLVEAVTQDSYADGDRTAQATNTHQQIT